MSKPLLPFSFVIIVLSVSLSGFVKKINSRDIWWHLKSGEAIIEEGIIERNRFSFTSPDHVWVYHEWLSGVIFYLIYAVGSIWGLVVSGSLIFTISISLVYLYALRSRGELGALFLFIFSFLLLYPQNSLRPWLFGNLISIIIVALLNSEGVPVRYKAWATLILITLFANLHGTFLICLLYILIHAFMTMEGRRILGALLFSIPITLVNPYGIGPHLLGLLYFRGFPFQRYITEWQGPAFNIHSVVFFIYLLLVLIAIVEKFRSGHPDRLRDATIFALLLFFSIKDFRNSCLFFIFTFPALNGIPVDLPIFKTIEERLETMKRFSYRTVAFVTIPLLLIAGGATHLIQGREPLKGYYVRAEDCPESAMEFLDSIDGEKRVFNNFYIAGYIIFRGFPRIRVFYDQRNDPYPEEVMNDYFSFHFMEPGWEEIPSKWGADFVFWKKDEKIAEGLNRTGKWKKIYEDRLFMILARKGA